MKKAFIILFTVIISAILFVACSNNPQAPEQTDTANETKTNIETEAVTGEATQAETDAETDAEETTVYIASVEIYFTVCNIEKNNASLSYTADGDAGKYKMYISDGSTLDFTVPGSGTITLNLTDKDNFAFDFTADGTSLAAEICYKNGLPQLNSASVGLIVPLLTDDELAHLTIGNWNVSQGSGGATYPIARFNIPKTVVADGPCGVRWSVNTVWYPSGSLIASTWDKNVVKMIGTDIGEDCISLKVDVILGPGMNIQRSVLNGRNFEYYSEDPFLTGMIASAYTDGVQSTGTGVSAKHYAVNNQETSRGSVSAEVSERALREIYLRGFGYLVRNSAPYTIMSSYNKVNATYSSVNGDLLSILRDEFGFKGYIMSDWGASGDAVARILAGNDLSMPGEQSQVDAVLNALENGSLSRRDAQLAAANILKTVAKSNALNGRTSGKINHDEQAADALYAAEQGMVLLKNSDDTLPYASGPVGLFGRASYKTVYGGEGSGGVNISNGAGQSIYYGIRNSSLELDEATAKSINTAFTSTANETNSKILNYLSDASKKGGLGIVTISRTTSEGADHKATKGDWMLSDDETELIIKVSEAYHQNGGKLLVILNTGNPIRVADWEQYADAILWCGMAGEQVGNAVAAIITGGVNPSGKLTCTWPVDYTAEYVPYYNTFPGSAAYSVYYDDIYVGYRFNTTFGVKAQYEFGYGLSYTEFTYSDISVSESSISDAGFNLDITVKVTNTGNVAGREVVQLYVKKPSAPGIEQPVKELCGFAKTELLQPGKSQTLIISVSKYELESYVDANSTWTVLAGKYTIYVASSVEQVRASFDVTVDTEIVTVDVETKCENTSNIRTLTQSEGFHPEKTNESLTKNATAVANGNEGGQYPAENICDGDKSTRWSGVGASGDKYITIDLGAVYNIDIIEIVWESNNANFYQVFASDDNKNFDKIFEISMAIWDTDVLNCTNLSARYLKIVAPASASWCSIYEVYVFGE